MSQNIIHICGPIGAGKTTLGVKIEEAFRHKIIMKDVDALIDEHIKLNEKTKITGAAFEKSYKKSFQQYIDDFIKNFSGKPILFVGLNAFLGGEYYFFKDKKYTYPAFVFDLHSKYNFYIDIDEKIVLQQRYDRIYKTAVNRLYNILINNQDLIFKDLLTDEKNTKKKICSLATDIMNFEDTRKQHIKYANIYRKLKYKFETREKIHNDVVKIIVSLVKIQSN